MQKTNLLATEPWLNLEDIVKHLSVSPDTIRAWIKKELYRTVVQKSRINLNFNSERLGRKRKNDRLTLNNIKI